MMAEQDADLVAKARAGDHEAFRGLVETHSRALFQLAYRMTGHEQDAEDIVQETFIRASRQLARFEARAGFATWLHRIAANCSIDLLRQRKRAGGVAAEAGMDAAEVLASVPGGPPAPDHAACHEEVRHAVGSVMDQLTALERAAFVFRHFENKSIEEIGSALDLSRNAAKQAVFRAVQKMRRSLEPIMDSLQ
jgi:RNA polymerase sigma-70 factor (ECF subfamily)